MSFQLFLWRDLFGSRTLFCYIIPSGQVIVSGSCYDYIADWLLHYVLRSFCISFGYRLISYNISWLITLPSISANESYYIAVAIRLYKDSNTDRDRGARFDSPGRFRNRAFFDPWITWTASVYTIHVTMFPRGSVCVYIIHAIKTNIHNYFAVRILSQQTQQKYRACIHAIASFYTVGFLQHVTNHISTNATYSTSGKFQFVDGRNVYKLQLSGPSRRSH